MKEGYWVNYRTGKEIPIYEHEDWIRTPGNAKKLGLPAALIKSFDKFRPKRDRDKFLLFIMKNAPVMRVRGHGNFVSFEYGSSNDKRPLDAVWSFLDDYAGPFTGVRIVNFQKGKKVDTNFQEFQNTMAEYGPGSFMRVASREIRVKSCIARELLALAREVGL